MYRHSQSEAVSQSDSHRTITQVPAVGIRVESFIGIGTDSGGSGDQSIAEIFAQGQ